MVIVAAILAATGLAATFWRQNREAAELDAQIADMSARAAHVRQIADRASKESRLLFILHDTRRKSAPLTELWEEISRLTPDSAYLTDFHLSESKNGERSVELAGFAQSAVGLPLLFGQSGYFTEAALTAPITSDSQQKLESFSMRLQIRTPPPATVAPTTANGAGAAAPERTENGEVRR
jgi:general secretion pathway protein L